MNINNLLSHNSHNHLFYFSDFKLVTSMDAMSAIIKKEETEEELTQNTLPFHWMQPDSNSAFIKLEPNTEKKDSDKQGKVQKLLPVKDQQRCIASN